MRTRNYTSIKENLNPILKVRLSYLKLWIEGEEEGLSCAIKAIADFKRLGCQRTKYLETKK